ncbi:MAG: imidazolonepropionase [Deltaproteobacteria bacterium]|nr:MAG: imidazolonepropionase [Deltaproteobacteria bacterium]
MNSSKNPISDKIDSLWVNVHLATMTNTGPYGMIENGALAVCGEKIAWVGKRNSLPADLKSKATKIYEGDGGWVTPGLVDCHTHLVYAGSRAREFELRLQGATYEEIARQGGGIRSTVTATREADEESLLNQSGSRLVALMQEGVTTVEIKSGYGLDLETEMRMLRVARRLGERYPVTVVPTFLGAHALPPEYEGKSDQYVDFVCHEVMPQVAAQKLAVAVDVFFERIGFTPEQTERVFKAAKKMGLAVKLHAEQLSDLRGAALAAHYGALSADHLEHVSEEGVKAMADSGTVAVLLPGAFYFLRETKVPPIDLLRRYEVPMALATDCNPGSSPAVSLLLMLNMACTLFRLTPEEALAGVTRNGARALGLQNTIGTLEPGKDADFVIWGIPEPAELAYRIGSNAPMHVVRKGQLIRTRET